MIIVHVAAQMWCLARLLPLMIGEKLECDSAPWGNFISLLEITDYLLAPNTCDDIIAYLKVLINDHHQVFKSLYPYCRITPKMHYLIHYPECMKRYASLATYVCCCNTYINVCYYI